MKFNLVLYHGNIIISINEHTDVNNLDNTFLINDKPRYHNK